ncbi:hypothetical protein AGLY_016505 [Aphis glycines]|uniref:Integrase catalytic domain-containing protein n=1 Tax=Aphis glycines TaxID=307491 RepID=A0A6G0SXP8_APHGL|nr:hypothetical protein AGLY_016505 [Aphis glycines]
MVLNLNDSTQNGSHWVAWKKMKKKKIYFDSFGINPPPKELVNYLGKYNLWYTNRKFQDYNDPPICGHLKRFPKRRIITHGIDDLWAVDLVIMRNFSDENEDTFSKFAWAFPLKKKDGISVSKAFEKIIEQAKTQNHQTPKLLHADKGLEFENKHFKNVLKKYSIHMYHTQNEEKSAIIERFNRTLNGKMRLCFEVQKSKKWINILQNLLDEYNFKDIHRSIGMKPCEVNKSNEDDVLHKLFSTKNKPKPKIKFSVVDRVKIKAYKKTFGNKYSKNWTKEIFILKEILNTKPITYKIIDLNNEEIEGIKKNDNFNKMDNKKTYPNKTCDKCNLTIDYTNWSAHLKSGHHGKNDIDQTIVPFRFNRTYKGIPINQENEKKYNYIKLMKNDIKKYVKKNQKKIIYMLIFVLLNTLKILKQLNIIYIKLQLLEIYSLLIKGTINLEMEILIFQLCKIANDLIITTGDYTHHYLDDIKIVEDLGNIKMCEFIKRNVNNNKMDNKKTHPNKICDKCNLTVSYKNWSRHLKSIRHQTNDVDQTIKPKFNKTYKETKETAFESRLITYIIKNNMGIKDIQLFLNRLDNAVIGRLKKSLTNKNLKVNIMFLDIFKRDDKCFLWAILSALHPVKKHAQRVTKYIPFKNDFDKELKGIEFPVKTTDVPKFVKRTKDISINIYYLEEKNKKIKKIIDTPKGNNIYHDEKLNILNICIREIENLIDIPNNGAHYLYSYVSCLPKKIIKGSGFINNFLNCSFLPELHWPGYNYLGPGTKLEKNKKPIKKLDEAARDHDYFYKDHKNTKTRHEADKILEQKAMERFNAPDTNMNEKIPALLTAYAMKSKRHLGVNLVFE